MSSDYLIVGQGLAGTILGRQLEQAGRRIRIVDSGASSASRVAAGVWNPVVVKRFMKTWLTDEALPFARDFYRLEEEKLGLEFFFDKPLLKILSNEHERGQATTAIPELGNLVSSSLEHILPKEVAAPFGGLLIEEAGYMDVPAYLNACREVWEKEGVFDTRPLEYPDLTKGTEGWIWKNDVYSTVVFCEGAAAKNNPWLSHLPFRNTKGELITVTLKGLQSPYILNKKIFVLPGKDSSFKVGATFHWNFSDLEPEQRGVEELLQGLKKILPETHAEVKGVVAGERPTIGDRRPVVGPLKEEGLFVLNGLGSRGVLLAPYLADCLIRHLDGEKEAIPQEARVGRFRTKV